MVKSRALAVVCLIGSVLLFAIGASQAILWFGTARSWIGTGVALASIFALIYFAISLRAQK